MEYCPPLDDALFLAIGSDVDIADPVQLQGFLTT